MSNSSILGGTVAPRQADGRDVDLLGPSDSSDSGSDVQGERPMATAPDAPDEWGAVVANTASDTDAGGTGERASADGDAPREGADILPDRVIDPAEANEEARSRRTSIDTEELAADEEDDEGDSDDTEDAR